MVKNYQFRGTVIPYGPSNLHKAIDKGAFETSNGSRVPLVKSFSHNPDDIVGYVDLVDSDDGVHGKIHINDEHYNLLMSASGNDISKIHIGGYANQVTCDKKTNHIIKACVRSVAIGVDKSLIENVELYEE